MTQWESYRFFFKQNYPKQIELYRKNITEAEVKLSEALSQMNTLDAKLATAITIEDKEKLARDKETATQDEELSKRAILLLMAEIEKTTRIRSI